MCGIEDCSASLGFRRRIIAPWCGAWLSSFENDLGVLQSRTLFYAAAWQIQSVWPSRTPAAGSPPAWQLSRSCAALKHINATVLPSTQATLQDIHKTLSCQALQSHARCLDYIGTDRGPVSNLLMHLGSSTKYYLTKRALLCIYSRRNSAQFHPQHVCDYKFVCERSPTAPEFSIIYSWFDHMHAFRTAELHINLKNVIRTSHSDWHRGNLHCAVLFNGSPMERYTLDELIAWFGC